MNDNVLLLKEVAKERDIVSLGVCLGVYHVCNGVQIQRLSASNFFCFMNLKLAKEKVRMLPGEKQRMCHIVYVVSQTIDSVNYAQLWVEGILDLCDISMEYYNKHRKDVVSHTASKKNIVFRNLINEALERSAM